jgi:nucleoside-diphosphate-sugar epimerase
VPEIGSAASLKHCTTFKGCNSEHNSGYAGQIAILKLLAAGYQVRTTVRSRKREGDVHAMLKPGGAEPGNRLSFIASDLENDAGWPEAVAGCEYVLHVASPLPPNLPKHEDELIVPAPRHAPSATRPPRCPGRARSPDLLVRRDRLRPRGTRKRPSTRPTGRTSIAKWAPTRNSKTLAERAAWDFIATEGGNLELSVVNPVGVFGPVLGPDYSTSILLVQRLMDGVMPGVPRLYFGVVDVRDAADLHLLAVTHPAAKGERFLAVAGDFMSMLDIAKVLKRRLGSSAKKVPARQLPDWLVRIAALRDPAVKLILPELGKVKNATNEKAKRVLGWAPRSNEEAIVATAESLARLGLVKDSAKKAA